MGFLDDTTSFFSSSITNVGARTRNRKDEGVVDDVLVLSARVLRFHTRYTRDVENAPTTNTLANVADENKIQEKLTNQSTAVGTRLDRSLNHA